MKLRFSSRHFVVAILALLAVNACTNDESDGIYYDESDGTGIFYDFESDGIYYNVLSEKDRTVEVTSGGYSYRDYRGNIVIPDGVLNDGRIYTVTSIGDYAFCYCDALTSVDLSSTSLTTIGAFAFTGSNALTSVEFPASLTTIEGFAFSKCDALTSVDLSSTSLTTIEGSAFSDCHALTRVELPASLTSIDNISCNVFSECTSLSKLTVDEDNPVFTSRNNVLYSKNLDTLVCYPTGLATNVVIPDRVRFVGDFPGKVSAIYCQPQTPPAVLFFYTFSDDVLMNAVLYVPIGTAAAYMQVYPWRDFKNIEESDFSTVGINGVTAQSEPIVTVRGGKIVLEGAPTASVIEVFSADGRCAYRGTGTVIEGLPQGAYVVRVGKFSQKLML